MLLPYHFHRGEYAAAAAAGEEDMRKFPPRTRLGWAAAYSFTALAYAHLKQPARALEICEVARAHINPEEREYFVYFAPVDAAYATALALTGDTTKSAEVFRDRIERLRAAGEHARVVIMHNYRVRLARLLGDEDAVKAAIVDMREAAAHSLNPAVHSLAERLSEERTLHSLPSKR